MEEENATIEIVDVDENGDETLKNEPIINIVLTPDCVQNTNAINGNIPLFIRKLWKIVNDENNEDIVGWNDNGDGFIIHDQLEFISKTLTKYFKHNQLSSFVRQLNLYDFHKKQQLDREELEFSHPFFLRDCMQLLPMIKRKVQTGRQKAASATAAGSDATEPSPQVQALLQALKDVKKKNASITTEMAKLRQENASIWGEMNSLQLKYSKQSKIINKLIHFLITYMQKQHNVRQPGRTVSTSNSNKYLKTGPKIMELDYRYRNNPHEFWSDFDSDRNVEQEPAYTVVEPSESIVENTQSPQQAQTPSPQPRVVTGILPNASPFNQSEQPLPQFDHSRPSSSKSPNSALQRARGSSENLGYLIDNSRVEMNSIKELFKSLTPEDMSNFYKLVNENYKNQEDEMSLEIDNEMNSLEQVNPPQESLIAMPEELNDINEMLDANAVAAPIPTQQMSLMQDLDNLVQESIKTNNNKMDAPCLDILSDDLLTDDLLSNVSVEQYFNID